MNGTYSKYTGIQEKLLHSTRKVGQFSRRWWNFYSKPGFSLFGLRPSLYSRELLKTRKSSYLCICTYMHVPTQIKIRIYKIKQKYKCKYVFTYPIRNKQLIFKYLFIKSFKNNNNKTNHMLTLTYFYEKNYIF